MIAPLTLKGRQTMCSDTFPKAVQLLSLGRAILSGQKRDKRAVSHSISTPSISLAFSCHILFSLSISNRDSGPF